MTQRSFGFWTVIDPLPVQRRALCRCACGVERRVYINDLKRGRSHGCRSCANRRAVEPARMRAARQPRRVGKFASNENQWIRDAEGRVVRRAA